MSEWLNEFDYYQVPIKNAVSTNNHTQGIHNLCIGQENKEQKCKLPANALCSLFQSYMINTWTERGQARVKYYLAATHLEINGMRLYR